MVSLNALITPHAAAHATLTTPVIQSFWTNVNKRAQRAAATDEEKKGGAALAIYRGISKHQRDALAAEWKVRVAAQEEQMGEQLRAEG